MLAKKKPVSGPLTGEAPEARSGRGAAVAEAAPTMIIPRDSEIRIDPHGQLSIRAPGNLVLQNSGSYGTLESVAGSIRIERDVEVEAVSVRCADRCYVQGSLTAWSVSAQALQIEEAGRAYIVLQETDRLEVGREARLVGNFASEKELFLLFSRFADQLRSLPFFDRSGGSPPRLAVPDDKANGEGGVPAAVVAPPPPPSELPEPLLFALVLLEREAARKSYGPTSLRALSELIKLLRERDLDTLRQIFRTLFSRIVEPREDVRRARELVEQFCSE
jgi:hypothetical protein